MACGKITVFILVILGSLTISLAEEGSGAEDVQRDDNDHINERQSFQFPNFFNPGSGIGQSPNFGQLFGFSTSNMSSPFGPFMSAFSQFFPNSGGLNQNSGLRQAEVHSSGLEANDEVSQDRLFFGALFGVTTGCNYATQAGFTCTGCREQLYCRPNNVGRLRVCTFLTPYCNNGRCSRFPGSACTTSSSSSAATTTTTTGGTTTT